MFSYKYVFLSPVAGNLVSYHLKFYTNLVHTHVGYQKDKVV